MNMKRTASPLRTHALWALACIVPVLACSNPVDDGLEIDELRAEAPDATGVGPLEVVSAEYKFPATVDLNVLPGIATELWAQVYRPKTLTNKHPVLVFLHGNHGTCGTGTNPRVDSGVQYTSLGTCPAGSVVTPNHLGYAYAAERLASWGYVVVSINANRGITAGWGNGDDGNLILARGRLVLSHLAKLAAWNAGTEPTPTTLSTALQGKLDLSQVGLMGHSRGGEGVRAALALYTDAASLWPARIGTPLGIKGIFEIAPVDGQAPRTLDARNTPWTVLLPVCDGDVSDLQGMNPFERMSFRDPESTSRPKSMFVVWGANHNFYNTEWQQSDSEGCIRGVRPIFSPAASGVVGSETQRGTGLHGLMSFFRGHVGRDANPAATAIFDPRFSVPAKLASLSIVERTYLDGTATSTTRVLESFAGGAAVTGSGGLTVQQYSALSDAAPAIRAAYGEAFWARSVLPGGVIKWAVGATPALDVAIAPAAGDLSAMNHLMLRLSTLDDKTAAPTVQLTDATGARTAEVSTAEYTDFGNARFSGHATLAGVRVPLTSFSGVNLRTIRGVTLRFDGRKKGILAIADLRASKLPRAVAARPLPPGVDTPLAPDAPARTPVTGGNRIAAVRTVGPNVELDLESDATFPVADEVALLQAGDTTLTAGAAYTGKLDTHTLTFTVSKEVFESMPQNSELVVSYGRASNARRWNMGTVAAAVAAPPRR